MFKTWKRSCYVIFHFPSCLEVDDRVVEFKLSDKAALSSSKCLWCKKKRLAVCSVSGNIPAMLTRSLLSSFMKVEYGCIGLFNMRTLFMKIEIALLAFEA
ncbi:hypothetical protein Q3G72_012703 [Acer saccharum]|nr:hypothetical protein Q3G72_012703 [Acer saccharum]